MSQQRIGVVEERTWVGCVCRKRELVVTPRISKGIVVSRDWLAGRMTSAVEVSPSSGFLRYC